MDLTGPNSRARVAVAMLSSALLITLAVVEASYIAKSGHHPNILMIIAAFVVGIACIFANYKLFKQPNKGVPPRLVLLLAFAACMGYILVPVVARLSPEVLSSVAISTACVFTLAAVCGAAFPVRADFSGAILVALGIVIIGALFFVLIGGPPTWWFGLLVALFAALTYYDSGKVYLGQTNMNKNVINGSLAEFLNAANIFTAMSGLQS